MNKPKQQGTRFETWLTRYLTAAGLTVHHLRPKGTADQGDLEVLDGFGDRWLIEAKHREHLSAHAALAAASAKAQTAGLPCAAVIWKRSTLKPGNQRRSPTGEPVVCLPLSTFRSLLVVDQ